MKFGIQIVYPNFPHDMKNYVLSDFTHPRLNLNTTLAEFNNSANGQGFFVRKIPTDMAPEGHYGLLGLHERAELIGGRLTIESEPNRGTSVKEG